VFVKTLLLSVDPYMRGCMSGLDNYFLPRFDLTEPAGEGRLVNAGETFRRLAPKALGLAVPVLTAT
jgi:NADPH-dependent curcumin reductase CurA